MLAKLLSNLCFEQNATKRKRTLCLNFYVEIFLLSSLIRSEIIDVFFQLTNQEEQASLSIDEKSKELIERFDMPVL